MSSSSDDAALLLKDLKQQVAAAEADLKAQVGALPEVRERLRGEYDTAAKLKRTAATWNVWLDERVTQVAVAWVLGTVFVRFAEDNRLIPEPYVTAPEAERRDLAEARYAAYVEDDENPTYRGWLRHAFEQVGTGKVAELLFDPRRNPLFQTPLSHEGAQALVEFWRRRRDDGGLVYDFTGWDTRFLGDLYQDLSEEVRKTYALLQTPEFVEEFILDRTMDPAVREFGFEELRMIDPTCGSGHFVLGAFRRLVKLWEEERPSADPYERVRAALESVHGVDINPFAVAIARFRLLTEAMRAAGISTFEEAGKYEWPMNLAVGDSLIKARQLELDFEGTGSSDDPLASFAYETEDIHEHKGILEPGRYHVVVGNPPYITPKDKNLNALYRELYSACSGKYALSVPFAQRFFELAKTGSNGLGYGMVGQITSNSFMKREFGTKLIEEYFADKVELTEVMDTSGAYIPGHGTPTVILVGKHRGGKDRASTIRTVRSVQGEPAAPENPEDGLVWRAIVDQIDDPDSASQWVSVDDLDRTRDFGRQPWILVDGGLESIEKINDARKIVLKDHVARVGFYGVRGADDAMASPLRVFQRIRSEERFVKSMVIGDEVRDFSFLEGGYTFHPYDGKRGLMGLEEFPNLARWIWRSRTELGNRATFSGGTYFSENHPWWQWHQLPKDHGSHSWTITFGEVATHNHFVLDRGGKVFNRTAPVIKLREDATEEDHLQLLGLLNSSTACLWLKMVCHSKGHGGIGGGIASEEWEKFYQLNGTNVAKFPLPPSYPTSLATSLDSLAQELTATSPSALAESSVPTAPALREAKARWESLRARMIFLQEELDWQVYSLYGLYPEDLRTPEGVDIDELALGQRAFEIVLARKVEAGEASGEWFTRHGSTPVTGFPDHWPQAYREVVQKRIDAMAASRAIGMVERPEYKRRWATEGWDSLQEEALRSWLLDRIEAREHWFDAVGQPALTTLARLTDALSQDADFVSVAGVYEPRRDLADVVQDLISQEHVPFLAALRYKPSGLAKRADWERTWQLQRQEDAAPDEPAKKQIRDTIKVPPKYTSADFLRSSYWGARGKLDVPKERFISYGAVNTPTPNLFGWAGWSHQEQAQALTAHIVNQPLSSQEIIPFLAGLLELQPWLDQWHSGFDALYQGSPAGFFRGYREQAQGENELTDDQLTGWRPAAAARRGRGGQQKKETR